MPGTFAVKQGLASYPPGADAPPDGHADANTGKSGASLAASNRLRGRSFQLPSGVAGRVKDA
jgi:hypothetical protein